MEKRCASRARHVRRHSGGPDAADARAGAARQDVLALVILAFSVQALRGASGWHIAREGAAWVFGLVAGVLGGAYGMKTAVAPLVVYGSARGWSPSEFRATLQGYFLPASACRHARYLSIGLSTSFGQPTFYLMSLPLVVLAIAAADESSTKTVERSSASRITVYMRLVAIAILLLIQSARSIGLLTIL